MYRPLAMGAVLLLLATPLLAEPSEPPPPLSPLEIHIPSITKKWKTPAGSSLPDITIDDIERCMGQDVGLQSEVQGLKQEQAQLESEQARLTAMHEELAQRSQSLETRRQAHQARVDQFQADSASLTRRLVDIDGGSDIDTVLVADDRGVLLNLAQHNMHRGGDELMRRPRDDNKRNSRAPNSGTYCKVSNDVQFRWQA